MTETPGEPAEHAASVLAPEIDFLADPDVAGLGRSLASVLRGAMDNPADTAQAGFRYALRLAEILLSNKGRSRQVDASTFTTGKNLAATPAKVIYRNPPADMSGVTMDDYLIHGPRQALEVIQEITKADTVDIGRTVHGRGAHRDNRRLPQRHRQGRNWQPHPAQYSARLLQARCA